MSRRARVIVLCEDNQHEAFARRFLAKVGRRVREIRVVKAQRSGGSGEQFVRETFPAEVAGLRRAHATSALVVLIDGDTLGVAERANALHEECARRGIAAPTDADHVFIFVPTRAIETWLAYLSGQTVDEGATYPHLVRERECVEQVNALVEMCERRTLREPAPPSLASACQEYERLRTALPP